MKFKKQAFVAAGAMLVTMLAYNNCGGFKTNSFGMSCPVPGLNLNANAGGTITTPTTPLALQNQNQVSLTVGSGSINQLSVTVTLCIPGTSNCVTIPDMLLDTGSSGVRVFSSALTSNFYSAVTPTGFGNCTSYADNTYDWGPVVQANVTLGSETAHAVPIQIIDQTYADGGRSCVNGINASNASVGVTATPTADVASSGYNGIVGVNFMAQDCGQDCVDYADTNVYFCCSGTNCSPSTAPLAAQIANPVSYLQYDNNGVMLSLPSFLTTNYYPGAASGTLTLGIGTQPNNTPLASVVEFAASNNPSDQAYTMMYTVFLGTQMPGFIDSGSGCLAFPYTNGLTLSADGNGYFTQAGGVTVPATQIGMNYSSTGDTLPNVLVNSYTYTFSYTQPVQPFCAQSLGNSFASNDFDWGLPFFFGRKVYVGLEGATSTLGTGLYWGW